MFRRITMATVGVVTAILICLNLFSVKTVKAKEVFDLTSKAVVLADARTGTVVYEKCPQERLQIASMVKIMTLNLIFEEIEKGNLSYDTEVTASENATSMGGSQAFLDTNGVYKAGELIKSIIVASANDSCVAMAEHIGGSVSVFVEKMNEKAKEWGMNNTYFVNCTGLPAPNQYCCASDVLKMTRKLIAHDGFFDFSTVWSYNFLHPSGRVTELTNTNKLSRFYDGCDGGKTGFTSEAKSCLSATAKRGATRLICVAIGAENSKTRNKEVSELLNYGFANYESKVFVEGGENIDQTIPVANGKKNGVGGYLGDDLVAFGKKGDHKNCVVKYEFNNISAPVYQKMKLGRAILCDGEKEILSVDILSNEEILEKNYGDFLDDIVEKW